MTHEYPMIPTPMNDAPYRDTPDWTQLRMHQNIANYVIENYVVMCNAETGTNDHSVTSTKQPTQKCYSKDIPL